MSVRNLLSPLETYAACLCAGQDVDSRRVASSPLRTGLGTLFFVFFCVPQIPNSEPLPRADEDLPLCSSLADGLFFHPVFCERDDCFDLLCSVFSPYASPPKTCAFFCLGGSRLLPSYTPAFFFFLSEFGMSSVSRVGFYRLRALALSSRVRSSVVRFLRSLDFRKALRSLPCGFHFFSLCIP